MLVCAQRVAAAVILLGVGHDAARVGSSSSRTSPSPDRENDTAVTKPLDLDWEACGGILRPCSTLKDRGCWREYIWMDVGGQSCRYSETHKLRPENQLKFARFEMERLRYKADKFRRTGCLFGSAFSTNYDTYGFKCYRRTVQIQRSLKFLRMVRDQAEKDGEPATREFLKSQEYTDSVKASGDMLLEGFEKYEESQPEMSEHAMKFSEGWRQMLELQGMSSKNHTGLGEQEQRAQEAAASTEIMLKAMGGEVTEEQRDMLLTLAQQSQEEDENVDMDGLMANLQADIHEGYVTSLDDKEISALQRAAKKHAQEVQGRADAVVDPMEDDAEATDNEAGILGGDDSEEGLIPSNSLVVWRPNSFVPDGGSWSLLEAKGRVATRGGGALKFLFTKALGWIVSRLAWLVIFLLASAINLIRIIFPFRFLGCVLLKFLKFITFDLLWWGAWKGDGEAVAQKFAGIVDCPLHLFQAAGFAPVTSLSQVPAAVILPAAAFASRVTGVVHLYKSADDLCEQVTCGTNAICVAGRCQCEMGFYPKPDRTSCGELQSWNGCRCYPVWSRPTALGIWTSNYHGCPKTLKLCKVDRTHHSFSNCEQKVQRRTLAQVFTGDRSVFDSCPPHEESQEVRPLKALKGREP
eukprot:TRINITY_DN75337_c0_g1_i1.p1 TRINITY_DN75337_c0_g1~~TRINITY_DN75337_c0_g1_i1.p1  ORF type:complete len:636 (+),score=123.43 TRINITY_DN75337_c0_g1_i1:61-1968(+)